jgi:hypothetical protein
MKSIRIISALLLTGLLFTAGCNKNKYTNGAATVSGAVSYKNSAGTTVPAPYAQVYINYNSSVAKTPYDQTLRADSAGKFAVKLPTGNYYFSASLTDAYGFNYSTVQGTAVNIGNTSDQVNTIAIIVQ